MVDVHRPAGTCILCESAPPIQNSHILPNFVIKSLKGGTPLKILIHSINPTVPPRAAWKGPYLCGACEQAISQLESDFASAFYTIFRAHTLPCVRGDQAHGFGFAPGLCQLHSSVSTAVTTRATSRAPTPTDTRSVSRTHAMSCSGVASGRGAGRGVGTSAIPHPERHAVAYAGRIAPTGISSGPDLRRRWCAPRANPGHGRGERRPSRWKSAPVVTFHVGSQPVQCLRGQLGMHVSELLDRARLLLRFCCIQCVVRREAER